jgi:tripartite-type tricarboxylate transporter receptor subunit TctC
MQKKILLSLLVLVGSATPVTAQSPYYQGKTITIITGSQTGDLYDIYARMIATHMGKHVPGAPNILVQNMCAQNRLKFCATRSRRF